MGDTRGNSFFTTDEHGCTQIDADVFIHLRHPVHLCSPWNFSTDTVTANMTLYAKWTYSFTTTQQYRDIVSLSGGRINGQEYSYGVFRLSRIVILSDFNIAKYETTYELWYEVRQWAISNGYIFANPGREGHDGIVGAAPRQGERRNR
jgi:hypothetical protein